MWGGKVEGEPAIEASVAGDFQNWSRTFIPQRALDGGSGADMAQISASSASLIEGSMTEWGLDKLNMFACAQS